MSQTLRIGIVGYSAQPFDPIQARALLDECLSTVLQLYSGQPIEIVSGLTNQGIPALAYELATERHYVTARLGRLRANKNKRVEKNKTGNNF